MLRNFLKNRKAQNTAEYALLIALVVAGVIAMQTFAQRALQARVHDASGYLSTAGGCETIGLGQNTQYEPYYINSQYTVNTISDDTKRLGNGIVGANDGSNRVRSGSETTTYNGVLQY